MKYFTSFQLKDTSKEGSKVLREVLARKIERQGKYGRVVTPPEVTAGHLPTLSAGFQLAPPVPPTIMLLCVSTTKCIPTVSGLHCSERANQQP